MAYATLAELTDRYGAQLLVALTDRADPASGTIDAGVVARALSDTAALIDAHLAALYRLPVETVPPVLRDIALAIAVYRLHVHEAPKKIEADWRDAMRLLEAIRDGRTRLPVAGAEAPRSAGQGVRSTDRERPFTAATLRGFV
jgi:phage gp36-like protein